MRVVNEKIIRALRQGVACKASANTRCDEQGNVYLFDHHIARAVTRSGNAITFEFNLCGFHTVTTLDRINALVDAFGGKKLWLQHGQAYRGPRSKTKPVPCPRGVDPKAHGALHHEEDSKETLPWDSWFDASRK